GANEFLGKPGRLLRACGRLVVSPEGKHDPGRKHESQCPEYKGYPEADVRCGFVHGWWSFLFVRTNHVAKTVFKTPPIFPCIPCCYDELMPGRGLPFLKGY